MSQREGSSLLRSAQPMSVEKLDRMDKTPPPSKSRVPRWHVPVLALAVLLLVAALVQAFAALLSSQQPGPTEAKAVRLVPPERVIPGARLVMVQMVHRHGARTPLNALYYKVSGLCDTLALGMLRSLLANFRGCL
jgi:hypothetical protein